MGDPGDDMRNALELSVRTNEHLNTFKAEYYRNEERRDKQTLEDHHRFDKQIESIWEHLNVTVDKILNKIDGINNRFMSIAVIVITIILGATGGMAWMIFSMVNQIK